jgi:hypothetical protein
MSQAAHSDNRNGQTTTQIERLILSTVGVCRDRRVDSRQGFPGTAYCTAAAVTLHLHFAALATLVENVALAQSFVATNKTL